MLLELALLILIGGAVFLFVLAPLIRPRESDPEPEVGATSSPADGQTVSDTL